MSEDKINKYTNGYYQRCDVCKDKGTSHFSGMCQECRKKNKQVNSIRMFGRSKNKPKYYEQEEDIYGDGN
jgi:hypothetical protein